MKSLVLAALTVLLSANLHAAELGSLMDQAKSATTGSMTSALAEQFGMTGTQAEGGIGSMLSLDCARLAQPGRPSRSRRSQASWTRAVVWSVGAPGPRANSAWASRRSSP